MKKIFILILLLSSVTLFTEEEENYAAIFQKMKDTVGAVDSIKTIRTLGTVTQPLTASTLQLPVEVFVQFPDKMNFKLENKTFIINGQEGWIKYDKGFYEVLSDSDLKILKDNLERNLIYILRNSDKLSLEPVSLLQNETMNHALYHLESQRTDYNLWIDMTTYLPYKITYKIKESEAVEFEKFFVKFQTVEDIMFPIQTRTYDEQGTMISENNIKELEINIRLDPELFE